MRTIWPVTATLVMAIVLAGCASLLRGGPSPERIAERGLAALKRGEYAVAIADLEWVATHLRDRRAGRHALLTWAAAELDPANPEPRPEVGAELLAEFRTLEDNPPWMMPVANTLRGLMLALRDTEERARIAERSALRAERAASEAAERARGAAREASQAEARQASLGNRVSQLERELAQTRQQLARERGEVERMRRALGDHRPGGP
jgi:hypothetical protein